MKDEISNVHQLNERQKQEALEHGFAKEKELEDQHSHIMAKMLKEYINIDKKSKDEHDKNA